MCVYIYMIIYVYSTWQSHCLQQICKWNKGTQRQLREAAWPGDLLLRLCRNCFPKVKLRRPWGKSTCSMLWLKPLPNAKLWRFSGKVTPWRLRSKWVPRVFQLSRLSGDPNLSNSEFFQLSRNQGTIEIQASQARRPRQRRQSLKTLQALVEVTTKLLVLKTFWKSHCLQALVKVIPKSQAFKFARENNTIQALN